ncbi:MULTISPECIES: roadblock/LC7 domain-containing protein [Streptomyces]|uniref:roadblock/LC7 domain-containing protein n=1 Tax=Streptomyces TaxID=1883 RepID=UPI001F1978DB|nr:MULTISPECIES: roadblock/LC7 domain-containing protein [Streptomyces]
MPDQPTASDVDMSFALDALTEEKGVLHAVLLSTDGLVLAHSGNLPRETADRTAAAASGTLSVAGQVGELAGTHGDVKPRKIIIDLPDSCVLVFGAGHRAVLAVAVAADMTSSLVHVATAATIKTINGLAPALSTRERPGIS